MDVSVSDATNHFDADVLLPPRKRLLAGLKRHSCSESTSQSSHENNQSPSPSSQLALTEFDIRVNSLLKCYKKGSNMSPEDIAQAAKSAAVVAAKASKVARAVAEEKAAVAAKAVAAAKTALDLVALISEDMSGRDNQQRKNKSKKQVPVKFLYKKYQAVEDCGKDEELARKLHKYINSSPRICRTSLGSDSKNNKHKKLKITLSNEKDDNGGGDSERSSEKTHSVIMDDKVSKSSKIDELEVTSKVKTPKPLEDVCVNGRKRGRIKQKKLPLSICSIKDQTSPKEPDLKKSLFSGHANKTAHHVSSPSSDKVKLVEVAPTWNCQDKPVEVAPTWKCLDFEVPRCIKQDKMVQL